MTDWTFYSRSGRLPAAGDLLRAIPTRRLLRLERIVDDGEEPVVEAVRAAELLVDLNATLRYQNDPDGALNLVIREPDNAARAAYQKLDLTEGPPAAEIALVVELSLSRSAIEAGYTELVDDVLGGLERVFPGGVAHDPSTGEVLLGEVMARTMDPELTRYSHIDIFLEVDEPARLYVTEQLRQLPPAVTGLILDRDGGLAIRGRVPHGSNERDMKLACRVAAELAAYARAGHVRLREHGVWLELLEHVDPSTRELPEEWLASRKRTVRGVISRLLGRD